MHEDLSAGSVEPDFGRRYTKRSKSRSIGDESPGRRQCPLLILDGPAEPDPGEHVRQIFLRNAAATGETPLPKVPPLIYLGRGLSPSIPASGRSRVRSRRSTMPSLTS